jgi:16S rRNA (guanine527-N7)-methyltransferase
MATASLSDVSRETETQLQLYVAHLQKWNGTINLIGKTTTNELWERHIRDALQLLPLIPANAITLTDLGSGAGLPGLVLAIAVPHLSITLVEQDQRKAAFLREAIRVVGLHNATVCEQDISKHQGAYDVVTARALAALSALCGYALPLIHNDSICLFPKGESYATELAEAQASWAFDAVLVTSATQEKSMIVSISKLKSLGGHP